jgi:glycosyltransferase involved in cell wall biosynthesis
MKIAIVTDAWHPQTNGVVQTLSTTIQHLTRSSHRMLVIEPGVFRTVACPTYPEIRLACLPYSQVNRMLREFDPQAVHIATEGTLGSAARRWCRRQGLPFTTSYHTQFPEYLRARAPIPLAFSYAHLRRFHGAARRTMVATPSMQRQLEARGFANLARWTRGVDTELFRPRDKEFLSLPRPIAMYVGRVAVEKNIEAFLRMAFTGSKVVVGDGPARALLAAKYPQAHFVGYQRGETLARHMAAADVFVFPSLTDTFGLVMLEAMACGVPVAAFPVTGPVDVVRPGVTGMLNEDLAQATHAAMRLGAEDCRAYALQNTWEKAAQQFLGNLVEA